MSLAIRFQGVSKKFTLQSYRENSFKELAINIFKDRKDQVTKEYWSLRDVDLEIRGGETVGIIGPNGAGKSTILKLISQIIYPTSGRITINGRVGALLELGTGFHPDMTGRENVYLNGSILGLSQHQIRQKINDIIEFAELERFIDLPVKNFSSGMYMRLGFSVAVHTQPDILLIDEVLAVGDFNFQRKCYERIEHLQKSGTTIVMVSHDPNIVKQICRRALWLANGQIQAIGEVNKVIRLYEKNNAESHENASEHVTGLGSGEIRITDVKVTNDGVTSQSPLISGKPVRLQLHYEVLEPVNNPVFGFEIFHQNGVKLLEDNTLFNDVAIDYVDCNGVIECLIDPFLILPGVYNLSVYIYTWNLLSPYDHKKNICKLHVDPEDKLERRGLFKTHTRWHHTIRKMAQNH